MFKAIQYGVGMAVGTLLYNRFLTSAHQFDWHRASAVGLGGFLGFWILSMIRSKKRIVTA